MGGECFGLGEHLVWLTLGEKLEHVIQVRFSLEVEDLGVLEKLQGL